MASLSRADSTAGDTTNASTYTSASFTPTAGTLLIVLCQVTGTADTGSPCTASANGITFTSIGEQQNDTDRKYAYVANQLVPASPSSMTVTVDVTGDSGTGAAICVLAATGMARVGSAAIRQFSGPDSNHPVGGVVPSVSFAAAPLTTNPIIGFAGNNVNGNSVVQPSGWTEDADIGYSTPATGTEVCHIDSGYTSTTVTWGSNMSIGSVSVIELDASAQLHAPHPSRRTSGLTLRGRRG